MVEHLQLSLCSPPTCSFTEADGQGNQSNICLKRPQAVAISMLPKHADPLLRFYAVCPAYAQREMWLQTWLVGRALQWWLSWTTAMMAVMDYCNSGCLGLLQ